MAKRVSAIIFSSIALLLSLVAVAQSKCAGPPYGDDPQIYEGTKEAFRNMASVRAKATKTPIAEILQSVPEILHDACAAKFDNGSKARFYSVGMTDLDFITQSTVGVAIQYFGLLTSIDDAKSHEETLTVAQFGYSSSALIAKHATIAIAGYVLAKGGLFDLSDRHGAEVALKTDNALPASKQALSSCSSGNCIVNVHGVAILCNESRDSTPERGVPCINVFNGEVVTPNTNLK
jgi:hypothetical protein